MGKIMEQLSFCEPRRVNFTQLTTFLRCPLEYKLRFVDKERGAQPAGAEILWGRVLHRVAYQYLSLPLDQRSVRFLVYRLEEEVGSRFSHGQDNQLRVFANSMDSFHHIFAKTRVRALELPFNAPFHDFTITGRIDCAVERRRSGLILFEFKYSNYVEFDSSLELDKYLQLLFYTLGLRPLGMRPVEGAYYFFDEGSMDAITLSGSVLEWGAKRLIAIIDQMSRTEEAYDFEPRLNRLCPTCGHRRQCSLYKP